MQIKVKSILFVISIIINSIFILFIIFSITTSADRFLLSLQTQADDYITAAAVVSAPSASTIVFDLIEITMKPHEKTSMQFSVVSGKKQGNILITALYDNDIISVTQTGYGIEITALKAGITLIQTLTNSGIKDFALITITE